MRSDSARDQRQHRRDRRLSGQIYGDGVPPGSRLRAFPDASRSCRGSMTSPICATAPPTSQEPGCRCRTSSPIGAGCSTPCSKAGRRPTGEVALGPSTAIALHVEIGRSPPDPTTPKAMTVRIGDG